MTTYSDNPRWRFGWPHMAALIVGTLDHYDVEPLDECDAPDWDERTMDAPGRYGA